MSLFSMNHYAAHTLRIGVILAASAIAGCSVADNYSSRAETYNTEALSARTSTSLLNVLRAAYRQPLQLTDISTVTGTATASGGLSSAINFADGGGMITPNLSLSGGPSFAVANLNTQEVFQGFLSPIETKTIGNLIAQGIRPEVILPLVISDVIIDDGRTRSLFSGSIEDAKQFRFNYSFVRQLIRAGLTVEPVPTQQVGPALNAVEAKSMMSDVLKASAASSAGSKVPALKSHSAGTSYRFEQSPGEWRFCFDPVRSRESKRNAGSSYVVRAESPSRSPVPLTSGGALPIAGFLYQLPSKYFCGRARDPENGKVDLTFSVRSLAGIYAYLGALTRIDLGIGGGPPDPVTYGENEQKEYLFKVWPGKITNLDISANYRGVSYSLATDPSGYDATGEVMRVLSDLQALQSKASSFPAPSVVPILQR